MVNLNSIFHLLQKNEKRKIQLITQVTKFMFEVLEIITIKEPDLEVQ